MADNTITVTLTAKDNASATFAKVGDSAQAMGEAIEQASGQGKAELAEVAKAAQDTGKAFETIAKGFVAGGAAGLAFSGWALQGANALESAMRAVNSIAGLSDSELQQLTATVRRLGVELAIDPSSLAEGLYDIQGSGFEAAQAIDILRTSAVAARAGLTSTSVAARAITAVLNAYRLSASEAGDVSDILFKIVDSGVISFETLANNMGAVLPIAAQLKVPLEEIAAAYAELTIQGISGPIAETGIAAIMRAALQPTQDLTDALDEYGYSSAEALIQTEGLAGFLAFLQEASGDSASAMFELLGTIEATNPALALTSNEMAGYISMLDEMGVAAQNGERTLGVFTEQTNTTAFEAAQAAAAWREFRIEFGMALQPIATQGLGIATEAARGLTTAFSALPAPLQTAAAGFVTLSSAAALGTGSLILALPKIMEFRDAMQALGGARGLLTTIARSGPATFGGIGAAATIAGVAIYGMYDATRDMVQASRELDEVWRNLLLGGAEDQARRLEEVRSEINGIIDDLGSGNYDWLPFGTGGIEVPKETREGISDVLAQAFTDSRIDAEAFFDWINSEVAKLGDDDAKIAFLEQLSNPDILIQFKLATDDTSGSVDEFGTSLQGTAEVAKTAIAPFQSLLDLFADFPATLDDLRLDGQHELARDIEGMDEAITAAFTHMTGVITNPEAVSRGSLPIMEMVESLKLTEPQLDAVGAAWDRVMSGMESGMLDNGALMAEWSRILQDSTLSDEAKVQSLADLSHSLADYRDSVQAMQNAHRDWLGQGENILDWWERYTLVVGQAGQNNAFGAMVDWAQAIGRAGDALDQALRIYQQIDDLGNRSSSAGSIAENLVGKPGEWAEIDDMLAAGTISLNEYTEATEAGHAVQESNIRVQSMLNEVRRNQLPILAEEQLAYEANIQYLTTLNAEEQRRALMLQDSSVQTQIATAYSTAYSASIGEIPKEVATEILANTAQADPALGELLVKLGLLNEEIGPDGAKTFSVNFPDADATTSAINRLTIAFLEMEGVASGMSGLDLAIKIYGEDEALELYGLVKDVDGRYVKATVDVQTTGVEDVSDAEAALKDVTLADGTVVRVKAEVDTDDWDQLTAADLARRFDNDPVKLPVEATIKPMDGWTADDWNNAIGPFPDIEVPVTPADVSAEDLEAIGASAASKVRAIELPVNPVIQGSPELGDGTGGAPFDPAIFPMTAQVQDVDTTAIPEDTTIPVTADTTAVDTTIDEIAARTVDGPTFQFMPEPTALGAIIGQYRDATFDGPTFNFMPDPTAMSEIVGQFYNKTYNGPAFDFLPIPETLSTIIQQYRDATYDGPMFDFVPEVGTLSTIVQQYRDASYSGPTFQFMPEPTALGAIIGQYRDASYSGPTFNFVANTSSVDAAISNYNGKTIGTSYVNVVTRSVGGGIPGFASGGVPFRGGEAGPELLHFASGGTAWLPGDGVYSAPRMSYVSPAPSSTSYGGDTVTINVTIQGSVVGENELLGRFATAIADRVRDRNAAIGVA